ncbi:class I SAM-dependent methyltransferase [Nocardia sp. AG03]|uniref:class I SAM-dependent methyltransferase n=1 Tax=Nocardia sp. AG03 TaxID=3025312 RepID=UPI0024182A2B|nr:class I SAM-dependent methyltransferase [Nocardia sp. AG03]
MLGPRHFDTHAEVYDRARPPYPEQLWQRLRSLGVLRPGLRVLDLGAGSGLATAPLVREGATVTAVEPGATLAHRLRQRLPSVTVHVATAETVPLEPVAFDLAVAATAVHWFDLDTVLPTVHRALVPDGRFAVWRTVFGDSSVPVTPFRRRVAAITARRGPGSTRPTPAESDTAAWVRELTRTGHFHPVHTAEFAWSIELDTSQIRDLFTTFSDWTTLEVDEAARAVDALGGTVVEHYRTPLIVLRRLPVTEESPR